MKLITLLCLVKISLSILVTQEDSDNFYMNEALNEAKQGLNEGGIPIGSVLVIDNMIVGRGHNLRVQNGSPILHAEMSALENAGRLSPEAYQRATLYTTLSPCSMCTGAANLFNISRIVIGENLTSKFAYGEDLLRQTGKEVVVMNNTECVELMSNFTKDHPSLWNEDIGVRSYSNVTQSETRQNTSKSIGENKKNKPNWKSKKHNDTRLLSDVSYNKKFLIVDSDDSNLQSESHIKNISNASANYKIYSFFGFIAVVFIFLFKFYNKNRGYESY